MALVDVALAVGVVGVVGGIGLSSTFRELCKYLWKKHLYRTSMHADFNGSPFIYTDHPVVLTELRSGDHIYFQIPPSVPGNVTYIILRQISAAFSFSSYMQKAGLPRYHHGVYLDTVEGQTAQVAEFGRCTEDFPVITSLKEFMSGNTERKLFIREVVNGYTFPPEEIKRRALKMEGDKGWGKYDWLDNNCEHFATYLKTGRVWSQQSYLNY